MSERRLRVLVVEDEMLVAMNIEDMLHDLGHEVAGLAGRLDVRMPVARAVRHLVADQPVHRLVRQEGRLHVEHGKVELAFAGERQRGFQATGQARHLVPEVKQHILNVHRDEHLVLDDQDPEAALRQGSSPDLR